MFKNENFGSYLKLAVLLLLFVCIQRAAGQQTYEGRNYGDAFSKMLVVTSSMQTNLYNSINRANAAKRDMFPELAGASQITQQEIANLCKPFPCGNEGMTARPGPITQQDVQKLCAPFPCGNEGTQPRSQPVPATPPQPRQFPITATDYQPVGARVLPDAMAAAAQGDIQTKQAVRALANQFLDAFEKEGRKNNVANGFGFLSSVSLQIVTGREQSEIEEQQLIAGFNNTLAASPQFASMSRRDKQLVTEAAVISGGFMAFLHVQGKLNNDAKMQADARQLATAAVAYFFGVQIR